MDGVRNVEPEAETNRVSVNYDETSTSEQEIAERLATAGYPVVT